MHQNIGGGKVAAQAKLHSQEAEAGSIRKLRFVVKGVAATAKRQQQRSFQSVGCRYHGQNGCSRRTEGTTGLTVGLEARVRTPRRDSEVPRGKVPARNERAQKRRPSFRCRVVECGRKTSPPGIVASSSFPPRREVIVPAPRLPRRRWARPRLPWPLSLLTWQPTYIIKEISSQILEEMSEDSEKEVYSEQSVKMNHSHGSDSSESSGSQTDLLKLSSQVRLKISAYDMDMPNRYSSYYD
nr:uncharacterized protein LOC131762987 [Kogia breviceps]